MISIFWVEINFKFNGIKNLTEIRVDEFSPFKLHN